MSTPYRHDTGTACGTVARMQLVAKISFMGSISALFQSACSRSLSCEGTRLLIAVLCEIVRQEGSCGVEVQHM